MPVTARGAVSVRFAIVAFVAPKFVTNPFVVVAFVDVTFVKIAAPGVVRPMDTPFKVPPAIVTLLELKFEIVPLVAKRFVEVVLVPVALVHVSDAGLNDETNRFVKTPSVAERRLPVAFVNPSVVTVEDPAEKLPPNDSEVPVAFVNVNACKALNPAIVSVPVTLKLFVIANAPVDVPPANWIVFVVEFPALVTLWKFPVVEPGQFTPFERQTDWPWTNRLVPEATAKSKRDVDVPFANERPVVAKEVAVAFVKTAAAGTDNPIEVPFSVPPVNATFPDERFVTVPLVEKRFVVVAFVPCDPVKLRFWNEDAPVTVNPFVTAKAPVEVPPANWIAFVVMFPTSVTACRELDPEAARRSRQIPAIPS
jgi:hypothetical protein